MGEAFILRRNIDETPVSKFLILAPSDSTISCNNPATIIPLDSTKTFVGVKNLGNYTVTSSKGVYSVSKQLTASYENQSELVEFKYRVPVGYKEVSFLEGTGTQYINTNIKNGFAIDIQFAYTARSSGYGTIFGHQNTGSPWAYTGIRINTSGDILFSGLSGSEVSISAYNTNINTVQAYSFNTLQRCIINGTQKHNDTTNRSYSSQQLVLFGNSGGIQLAHGRIYYVKIYSDQNMTIPLRDFIPCYRESDNVAGMWDTVTETFFTNNGSGSFTIGEEI